MKRDETPSASETEEIEDAPETARARTLAPEIRRLLLEVWDEGSRDLPWRGESDPYRVWVSEIMLQQTRVETVIPYYKEWVTRFPDLEALAAAEEEKVLRAWQGLGYYSRARNLHGAAKLIRERLGGRIPGTMAGLRALPGVGEYTAGAVASIAFGKAVPAVDGNVTRVLSRLFDLPNPGAPLLRELAGELVAPDRPGDFNQALMELGALVCIPRGPKCEPCPLQTLCLARQRGSAADRPRRKKKKPVPELDVVVIVAVKIEPEGSRFLLRKRPHEGLLAGMWEFPGVEMGVGDHPPAVADSFARDLGIMEPGAHSIPLEPVTHAFTHLKVRYRPFLFPAASANSSFREGKWLCPQELDEVPLPVAQGKILRAAEKVL